MYNDKTSVLPFESFNDFAHYAESFVDFIIFWRSSILVCALVEYKPILVKEW